MAYDYERRAPKIAAMSHDDVYRDAKKTYQKLTELLSDLDYEKLTPVQADSLKAMHKTAEGWIKKMK